MKELVSQRLRLVAASLGACASVVLALSGCSNSATDYLSEGKAYLDKSDLKSAVISFKSAVQADPNNLAARRALAESLERSGDLVGAEQQYRRALEAGGDADELVPKIAVLILDRAENAVLIKDFSARTLKSAKADSDLRAIVALAYLGAKQPAVAEEQLRKAKEQTSAVRLARAQAAFLEKRRVDVTTEMDAIVKSNDVPWWVARAASRAFQAAGEPVKALAVMKRAYDAAPLHQGVLGEYAEQLIAAGRRAEARPLREKMRSLYPGYYRTQYLDALFLMEDGKGDQAYTAATKVLAAIPAHMPSQIIAATIELERNELASVESRVSKILGTDPDSVEGHRLRASLELQRGNLAAAAASLDKALKLAPDDRGLLATAGAVAWAKGDRTGGIRLLGQAANQEPPQGDLLAKLAEMLHGDGRRDEATNTLKKAISVAKELKDRDAVFNAALRLQAFDQANLLAENESKLRPKDPEPLLWKAAVVGAQGNEAGALEQTRRALDLKPDFYLALTALAKTANTAERKQEYANRLQKAVDAGSKDSRIYLDRARQLGESGAAPEKVGEVFDKGLAVNKADVALCQAAIAYWLKTGNKDKAVSVAKEGEAAAPDNGPMIALAASVQEAIGEAEQAATRFAKLAERFPDRVDWNLKHAGNLVRSDKKDEAIKVLRRLVQLRPDEPAAYEALATVQAESGAPEDARVTAEQLRDKPNLKGHGLLLLGDVYLRAKQWDQALKAYSGAVDYGAAIPGIAETAAETALQRKVGLLDRTGRTAQANSELTKWMGSHPNSVAALSLSARRASERADYRTAAKHLEVIAKADPKNATVLNDLAWAYVMARDPQALAAAAKAIELAPDNPIILDTLSQAQLNAGQKSEAQSTLRKALKVDASLSVVRLHLAELVAEGGDKKEAQDLMKGVEEKGLDKEAQVRFRQLKQKL